MLIQPAIVNLVSTACRYLEKAGVPLATAQVQFSLLSRGPDQMTTQAVCRDLGITLIAYSPLGLGAPQYLPRWSEATL